VVDRDLVLSLSAANRRRTDQGQPSWLEDNASEARGCTDHSEAPGELVFANDPDLVACRAELLEEGERMGRLVESAGESAKEDQVKLGTA
jgi:hypothetical protein